MGARMRVLIIDDDPDLRNLLVHYIRQQWPAGDIEEYDPLERGMPDAKFSLAAYDVIILDYMLGRGDGLQWLTDFKKRGDCPPIIFLTGAGNEIIAVRAMKAGADEYQRKQELTKDKLITAIRDVAHDKIEKTVAPDIAARMEGHSLGARIKIPGIKVLRLIGEGGMSRVYLASREKDDEPLVVKILRGEVTEDKRSLARFIEEYNLVERIRSRHVARIYGHGVSESHAYLVMEFFDGGDLNKRLGDKAMPPGGGAAHLPRADARAGRHPRAGHPAPGPQAAEPDVPRRRQPGDRRFRHRQARRLHRPHQPGRGSRHAALHEPGAGAGQGARPAHRHLQRRRPALPDADRAAPVRAATPRSRWRCITSIRRRRRCPQELERYQRLFDKLLEKDREARFRNADEVIGFLSRKFYQGH